MDKYLVTLELRYNTPDTEDESGEYKTPKMSLGVYDTLGEANDRANKFLREMESKYNRHIYPDGGQAPRVKMGDSYASSKRYLVSELSYLKTPFSFFLKVVTLKGGDPWDLITRAEKEIKG